MAKSADSDKLAEASWSGSALFAKAGYIWAQQDKGYGNCVSVTCKSRDIFPRLAPVSSD